MIYLINPEVFQPIADGTFPRKNRRTMVGHIKYWSSDPYLPKAVKLAMLELGIALYTNRRLAAEAAKKLIKETKQAEKRARRRVNKRLIHQNHS